MSHYDFMRRSNEATLQKAQTNIMFCDECGAYGHSLPINGGDIGSGDFLGHVNCGGEVRVSNSITHSMLDHLSAQQADILRDEIDQAIRRHFQSCQQYDDFLLSLLASERKRINTHAPARPACCPLIFDFKTVEFLLNPDSHPRCPNCNSLLVQEIRFRTRLSHFFFRDPPESLQGKTMECLECWHRW